MNSSKDYSKMKDSMGRFITQGLFLETVGIADLIPIFTLKPYNHTLHGKKYPSLKLLYMALADFPNEGEYNFALEVFGPDGWSHWKRICDNKVLYSYISKWREELEVKRKSEQLRHLCNAAKQGTKGIGAAKYIMEKGWEKRAGRPTKAEIDQTKRVHAGINAETKEDMQRLIDDGLIPEERH